MQKDPKKEDAKITGIFIPFTPDDQHDPFIMLHAIPIKITAENMMAKLNDEKWDAFQTGRIKHMTKRARAKHDEEFLAYQRLLNDANELLKPYLN